MSDSNNEFNTIQTLPIGSTQTPIAAPKPILYKIKPNNTLPGTGSVNSTPSPASNHSPSPKGILKNSSGSSTPKSEVTSPLPSSNSPDSFREANNSTPKKSVVFNNGQQRNLVVWVSRKKEVEALLEEEDKELEEILSKQTVENEKNETQETEQVDEFDPEVIIHGNSDDEFQEIESSSDESDVEIEIEIEELEKQLGDLDLIKSDLLEKSHASPLTIEFRPQLFNVHPRTSDFCRNFITSLYENILVKLFKNRDVFQISNELWLKYSEEVVTQRVEEIENGIKSKDLSTAIRLEKGDVGTFFDRVVIRFCDDDTTGAARVKAYARMVGLVSILQSIGIPCILNKTQEIVSVIIEIDASFANYRILRSELPIAELTNTYQFIYKKCMFINKIEWLKDRHDPENGYVYKKRIEKGFLNLTFIKNPKIREQCEQYNTSLKQFYERLVSIFRDLDNIYFLLMSKSLTEEQLTKLMNLFQNDEPLAQGSTNQKGKRVSLSEKINRFNQELSAFGHQHVKEYEELMENTELSQMEKAFQEADSSHELRIKREPHLLSIECTELAEESLLRRLTKTISDMEIELKLKRPSSVNKNSKRRGEDKENTNGNSELTQEKPSLQLFPTHNHLYVENSVYLNHFKHQIKMLLCHTHHFCQRLINILIPDMTVACNYIVRNENEGEDTTEFSLTGIEPDEIEALGYFLLKAQINFKINAFIAQIQIPHTEKNKVNIKEFLNNNSAYDLYQRFRDFQKLHRMQQDEESLEMSEFDKEIEKEFKQESREGDDQQKKNIFSQK